MKTVKLIVYGTLLSGERNQHFCRNAVKITPCTVTGTLYDTGCGFPAFQAEGNTAVKAELIELPIADWASVDRLEGTQDFTTANSFPAHFRTVQRIPVGFTSRTTYRQWQPSSKAELGKDTAMDKTILIEKTSKHLKRWELIVTAALFLTLITGFGTLYIAIPLAIAVWSISGMFFLAFLAVRTVIWWNHG